MSISIENIAECKRRVTIEIPADEIQTKQEQKMQEFKGASIKGFRPGKAPIDRILKQIFGGQRQFRSSVVQGLLDEKFNAAVKEHDIELADSPQLDDLSDSGEGNVTFSAICDVYPKFDLPEFSQLQLGKRELEITEEEYNEQLDGILKLHGTCNISEDNSYEAKLGDRMTVDFILLNQEGSNDNSNLSPKTVEIALDDNVRYGFEKDLPGMKVNESKKIDGSNGRQFEVTVKSISTCTKAELNDELAQKMGVHCVNDIRGHIEDKLNAYALDVDLKRARALLLDKLVETYKDLSLPDKLIERYTATMNQGEFNSANLGRPGTSQEDQIRRAIILDLMRAKISKKFDLRIDEERVIELITRLALSTFGNYDLVLDLYSKNPALLNQVRTLVLDEQITKLVLEHTNTDIKKVSLTEIENVDAEPLS